MRWKHTARRIHNSFSVFFAFIRFRLLFSVFVFSNCWCYDFHLRFFYICRSFSFFLQSSPCFWVYSIRGKSFARSYLFRIQFLFVCCDLFEFSVFVFRVTFSKRSTLPPCSFYNNIVLHFTSYHSRIYMDPILYIQFLILFSFLYTFGVIFFLSLTAGAFLLEKEKTYIYDGYFNQTRKPITIHKKCFFRTFSSLPLLVQRGAFNFSFFLFLPNVVGRVRRSRKGERASARARNERCGT